MNSSFKAPLIKIMQWVSPYIWGKITMDACMNHPALLGDAEAITAITALERKPMTTSSFLAPLRVAESRDAN